MQLWGRGLRGLLGHVRCGSENEGMEAICERKCEGERGAVPSYSGLRFAITLVAIAAVLPQRIRGMGADMLILQSILNSRCLCDMNKQEALIPEQGEELV